MKAVWKNRRTLVGDDMVLRYHKTYDAQLRTLADNMHILTVTDMSSGAKCNRRYSTRMALLKDWMIVDGELW